jgi:hypothetical protein
MIKITLVAPGVSLASRRSLQPRGHLQSGPGAAEGLPRNDIDGPSLLF